MIKVMKHNFGMKVLAFVLALTAWGFTRALDPIETWQLELDVEVRVRTGSTIVNAGELDQTITALATGPASRLQRLQSADPAAVLNCRNVDHGIETDVPYRLDRIISGIDIEFEPAFVTVEVNEITIAEFIPEEILFGSLPPGLQINSTSGLPNSVEVEGASSLVDTVDRVTYTINQWQLSSGTTELLVEFVPVNELNEAVEYLDTEPVSQEIEISIASLDYWIIPIVPDYTGEPPENYIITSWRHEPTIVEVTGPKEILENIESITSVPINLAGRTSSFEGSYDLITPPGVSLATNQIQVRIGIQSIITSYDFEDIPVQMRDTSPDLTYELQPSTVNITVQSLPSRTQPVTPDLVIPSVSMRGYGVGTYEVRLNTGLPTGTQLASITPETVTVVVSSGASDGTGGDTPPEDTPGDENTPAGDGE